MIGTCRQSPYPWWQWVLSFEDLEPLVWDRCDPATAVPVHLNHRGSIGTFYDSVLGSPDDGVERVPNLHSAHFAFGTNVPHLLRALIGKLFLWFRMVSLRAAYFGAACLANSIVPDILNRSAILFKSKMV